MRTRILLTTVMLVMTAAPLAAAGDGEPSAPEAVVGSVPVLDCDDYVEMDTFGEKARCARARLSSTWINQGYSTVYFTDPHGNGAQVCINTSPCMTLKYNYNGWFLSSVDAYFYIKGEGREYGTYTFHACKGTVTNSSCSGDEVTGEFDIAPVCLGKVATQWGTEGDDTLIGTSKADVLVGLGGNDVLEGRRGNDLLCGEAGNDELLGGDGDDTLFGKSGSDVLDGGSGADLLLGRSGRDKLIGGPGDDDLRGGVGVDTAVYEDAPGSVRIELGVCRVTGADGTDVCNGVESALGSMFNDVILGSRADNTLSGNGGRDRIKGKGGADLLLGGDGNDLLVGGTGNDTARGGQGKDTCRTEVRKDCER